MYNYFENPRSEVNEYGSGYLGCHEYIAKTEGWFELCQISLWLRTMKT